MKLLWCLESLPLLLIVPVSLINRRALARLLHVTGSTFVPFCASTERMVFCALETCHSMNELPTGAFLMSIWDLSTVNHCEEGQNGCCYPVRGVQEFRLGRRYVWTNKGWHVGWGQCHSTPSMAARGGSSYVKYAIATLLGLLLSSSQFPLISFSSIASVSESLEMSLLRLNMICADSSRGHHLFLSIQSRYTTLYRIFAATARYPLRIELHLSRQAGIAGTQPIRC